MVSILIKLSHNTKTGWLLKMRASCCKYMLIFSHLRLSAQFDNKTQLLNFIFTFLGFGWASHRALQTHILCVLHSTSALNHTLPSFSMSYFVRKIKIFSEDCFVETARKNITLYLLGEFTVCHLLNG